jgi:hypothetical protein
MLARIEEVQRLVLAAEASSREETLRRLEEQQTMASTHADGLKAVNDQLVANSGGIWETLRLMKQVLASILEMKETLVLVAKVVVSDQLSASSFRFFRFMDPTRELPVLLEDALGRQLTLVGPESVDCISWRVSTTPWVLARLGKCAAEISELTTE